MHTRAALIVLSRIVLVFPTQPKTGEKILKTLGPLQSDDNERPDIRATAQGYSSQLAKARDEGMWKEENMAVTKARQEREKMKVEERKKKLAKQHEDIKKESEMISRQLGDGGRDSWRPDRRDDRRDDRGRPWGMDPRMHPRVSSPNVWFECATILLSRRSPYAFFYSSRTGPATSQCQCTKIYAQKRRVARTTWPPGGFA